MSGRVMVRFCFSILVLAAPLLVPLSAGSQGTRLALEPTGFDRDGYADLAIGVPGESVGSIPGAGAVNVLYGQAGSLSTAGAQFWHQDAPNVGDQAESEDEFGIALAAGDLDGDGYGDLAVGVHWEDIAGVANAGAVNVLHGTPGGLVGVAGQFWHQGLGDVQGEFEPGDGFGRALAIGDFDGDGYDDLAAGVPWEDLGALEDTGAVHVFYGSPGGISGARDRVLDQADPEIVGDPAAGDEFGRALATGDLNGDGYDDLAIGVPQQDIDVLVNAGRVIVIYGSPDGLLGITSEVWDLHNPEILESAAEDDLFGDALTAGDFDADGYDDLVVGIPHRDVAGHANAGAALILYGTATGLSAQGHQLWSQASAFEEAAEPEDLFGAALAAGDLNGDGYEDLAIGAPFEDVLLGETGVVDAGAVNILYGSSAGLIEDGNQLWYQGRVELLESPEDGDTFGFALAIGDLNDDGFGDLAVGVPGEGYPFDGTERANAGVVQIIYGSATGLTVDGNQLLRQDDPNLDDAPENDDLFGFALAAIGNVTLGPERNRIFLPIVLRNY